MAVGKNWGLQKTGEEMRGWGAAGRRATTNVMIAGSGRKAFGGGIMEEKHSSTLAQGTQDFGIHLLFRVVIDWRSFWMLCLTLYTRLKRRLS